MTPDGYWVQTYPQNLTPNLSVECKALLERDVTFKKLNYYNDRLRVIHFIFFAHLELVAYSLSHNGRN